MDSIDEGKEVVAKVDGGGGEAERLKLFVSEANLLHTNQSINIPDRGRTGMINPNPHGQTDPFTKILTVRHREWGLKH